MEQVRRRAASRTNPQADRKAMIKLDKHRRNNPLEKNFIGLDALAKLTTEEESCFTINSECLKQAEPVAENPEAEPTDHNLNSISPTDTPSTTNTPNETSTSTKQTLLCTLCSYKTSNKLWLKRHARTHRGKKPSARSPGRATAPQVEQQPNVPPAQKTFPCTVCSYTAPTKHSLTKHMKTHNPAAPEKFACPHCKFAVARSTSLDRHMKLHADQDEFACKSCEFKTSERILFKAHVCEKPFPCNLCKAGFQHRGNLQEHMSVHANDKPFACAKCDYRGARKEFLIRHITSHLAKKGFACTLCSYSAVNKKVLRRHVKTHGAAKERVGIDNALNTSHREIHTDPQISDQLFKCNLCEYKALRESSLTQHKSYHVL